MHPKGQFVGGNTENPGTTPWRECSVGGDVFGLRESRSAQQKGEPVRNQFNIYLQICPHSCICNSQMFFFIRQIYGETNILQDGTLIDLCGATLLWRSAEGLKNSPVQNFISNIIHH